MAAETQEIALGPKATAQPDIHIQSFQTISTISKNDMKIVGIYVCILTEDAAVTLSGANDA
jgi:hypothetical protein